VQDADGTSSEGQSDFVTLVANGNTDIPDIAFGVPASDNFCWSRNTSTG